MKISIVITLGIVAVISIAVIATIGSDLEQSSQNKIRVAFFPSIGHAVPIVGIENGIFEKGIGEQFQFILRDESVHLAFGSDLINTIVDENPSIWTDEFTENIRQNIQQSVEYEYSLPRKVCHYKVCPLANR